MTLIDTGERQHDRRSARVGCAEHLGERFLLTYGDGLSDVPIDEVIKHHEQTGALATITAVHPPPRFGALEVVDGKVIALPREAARGARPASTAGTSWPSPRSSTSSTTTRRSSSPASLGTLAERGQLGAYEHDGFWMPMDTLRERDELNRIWDSGSRPVGRGALVTGSAAPLNDRGIDGLPRLPAPGPGVRPRPRRPAAGQRDGALAGRARPGVPAAPDGSAPTAGWARSASTSSPSASSAPSTRTSRRCRTSWLAHAGCVRADDA